MKATFPLFILCLSFIGCSAQLLENQPTKLHVGWVLIVGENGTISAVSPETFRGMKGDKGETGQPGQQGVKGDSGTNDLATLIDSAKDYSVLGVVDHKLKAIPANYVSDYGSRKNETTNLQLASVTASKSQYYVSAAGSANEINGALTIKYTYTNTNGIPETKFFPTITETGAFSPALYSIEVLPGTKITIYTEVIGSVNYNISYSIHQQ